MNLIEATQDMNKPDRLIRKGELHTSAAMLDDDDNLVDLQGAEYGLDKEDILANDWEIIKAEPEVLTDGELARNWFDEYNNLPATTEPTVNQTGHELGKFAELCTKNGQNKEWNRLKPLIDAAIKVQEKIGRMRDGAFPDHLYSELYSQLKNLTPPWEPEK